MGPTFAPPGLKQSLSVLTPGACAPWLWTVAPPGLGIETDASSFPFRPGQFTFTCDEAGNLKLAREESSIVTGLTGVSQYDAFNNLVRGRLDADGAGGGFTEKLWIDDGDEAILEFASSTATAPSHRCLWGPAVDQILADEQVATGSPSDVRWTGGRLAGPVSCVRSLSAPEGNAVNDFM